VRGTLRTRRHFGHVYESGRKAVGALCVVYAHEPGAEERAELGDLAVGVVASRKVGNAVRRNRAKRLLREANRGLQDRVRRPCWLVLIARRAAAERGVTSGQVSDELETLLHELGCLRPPEDSSRDAVR